jgi:hypothetical protein
MVNIKEVTFHFANPSVDDVGQPILNTPPESHTLTWQQVVDNVGFSLSTGESMFTELPIPSDSYTIRVINGFYFGTGKYGSLLAIQYKFEDGTDGWIKTVKYQSSSSEYIDQMIGNWIKGLTLEEIQANAKWLGKPYIGLENDYVEVTVERILPDLTLTLTPMTQAVTEGDSIEFVYSALNYCSGTPTFEWIFNTALIAPLLESAGKKTLKFNQQGSYTVELIARNICGQVATQKATITVQEKPAIACDLSLTPNTVSIRLGDTVTFDALHPYQQTGIWTYDPSLVVLQKDNKQLRLNPVLTGQYSIAYKVNECEERSILYVLPKIDEAEHVDPIEPAPPALPDTPPDTGGSTNLVMDLLDASKPIPPLYKYPNIMKRNSRYRGHRESEKTLNDHQEQIYDIRQLQQDISNLDTMKDTTIDSWFNGVETLSISTKAQDNEQSLEETPIMLEQMNVDSIRGFNNVVIQSSGNSFEESMIGIYGIKRRMQELDERVAEAERRYREYENAYE